MKIAKRDDLTGKGCSETSEFVSVKEFYDAKTSILRTSKVLSA